MKKLSLKTFSYYYLRRLNEQHNFKVNQMLQDIEYKNVRLYAPLLAWCYFTKKAVPKQSKLALDLSNLNSSGQISETMFLSYCQKSSNLELQKFVHSFQAENKRRENQNQLKEGYRSFFQAQKREKNLSSYRLAKMAKAQQANFDAFLKGRLDCLSLKKCELLFNQLT